MGVNLTGCGMFDGDSYSRCLSCAIYGSEVFVGGRRDEEKPKPLLKRGNREARRGANLRVTKPAVGAVFGSYELAEKARAIVFLQLKRHVSIVLEAYPLRIRPAVLQDLRRAS